MSYKFKAVASYGADIKPFFKSIIRDGVYFVVSVSGVPNTTRVFTKKKHPAKNDSAYSAITLAREYASAMKKKYPDKRVVMLQSYAEAI